MPRLIDRLLAVVLKLNAGLIVLAGWGILIITVLTAYSVIMRYVFKSPDIWTYPTSAYLLCFVVFCSLAHTYQEGVHVRVDYIMELLPRPLRLFFQVLGDMASSIFLALFTWQLWRLFSETVARNRIDETTLGLPLVAIQWVLPLCAALLLLTHLLMALKSASHGTYGKQGPSSW